MMMTTSILSENDLYPKGTVHATSLTGFYASQVRSAISIVAGPPQSLCSRTMPNSVSVYSPLQRDSPMNSFIVQYYNALVR